MLLFAFVASAFVALSGCTKKAATPVGEMTAEQLIARGKSIYVSNCIACHSPDPAKDGTVGPAVAGSSKELLEERLLHAAYPPNYKPKRDTRAMVAMPHLKEELPALTAYLESLGPGGQ